MHIGRAGYGLVDVSGNGLVSVADTVYFGEDNAAGTGYINISENGVFEAKIFQPSKGKGYISFDGGTLRAKASGMFFNGNAALFVTVGENGGTIDTQAFTVTNMMASCEGTGTALSYSQGPRHTRAATSSMKELLLSAVPQSLRPFPSRAAERCGLKTARRFLARSICAAARR